ncbi:hypothetical protein LshimejAT787_0606050 [Lyophyllum shimeji]|uniref:Uncharacterized protein n=1 Tax=Lyophyllum shimeji TaxID=47721 RepID=A0A9P3UN95_LYOSH|nr:hypothetical protein LshimejAT787_0606050 [Lyophyllum shimeji]
MVDAYTPCAFHVSHAMPRLTTRLNNVRGLNVTFCPSWRLQSAEPIRPRNCLPDSAFIPELRTGRSLDSSSTVSLLPAFTEPPYSLRTTPLNPHARPGRLGVDISPAVGCSQVVQCGALGQPCTLSSNYKFCVVRDAGGYFRPCPGASSLGRKSLYADHDPAAEFYLASFITRKIKRPETCHATLLLECRSTVYAIYPELLFGNQVASENGVYSRPHETHCDPAVPLDLTEKKNTLADGVLVSGEARNDSASWTTFLTRRKH